MYGSICEWAIGWIGSLPLPPRQPECESENHDNDHGPALRILGSDGALFKGYEPLEHLRFEGKRHDHFEHSGQPVLRPRGGPEKDTLGNQVHDDPHDKRHTLRLQCSGGPRGARGWPGLEREGRYDERQVFEVNLSEASDVRIDGWVVSW